MIVIAGLPHNARPPHPMSPGLRDPNNHVPELAPEDDWEDIADCYPSLHTPGGLLPPRRKSSENSAFKFQEAPLEGLRIDPESPQRLDYSSDPLEIHELSGKVIRLNPDITRPSKIPNLIVFQETPAQNPVQKRITGEGKEWGDAHKKSHRWLIGASIGVATIVITGLLLLPLINEPNTPRPRPDDASLVLDSEDAPIEGMAALNDMMARQPQAERIFATFASADLAEDFLPWVRDAETLGPMIRSKNRPAQAPKEWRIPEDRTWNIIEASEIPCGLLEATLPDSSKCSAYFALEGDRLQLDWKATTGYCSASFAELAQRSGDSTEIRGWIVPSNYYTTIFPEAYFQSYQLLAPDKNESLWCYTERNSSEDQDIARLFSNGEIIESSNEQQKVTIRLESSRPEAFPNQRLIGKLLHKEWIHP